MIRWLGLILLVLSIHPAGFAGPAPATGHAETRLAAWSLTAPDTERHDSDWSVDAYDDDDRDDSAPTQPGARPGASDDDVICAGFDWGVPPRTVRLMSSPLAGEGLRPARGHSPDTERPPRSA